MINFTARFVILVEYEEVSVFTEEDTALVNENGMIGFACASGQLSDFSEGMVTVKKSDKWGVANNSGQGWGFFYKNGDIFLPLGYASVENLSGGILS